MKFSTFVYDIRRRSFLHLTYSLTKQIHGRLHRLVIMRLIVVKMYAAKEVGGLLRVVLVS